MNLSIVISDFIGVNGELKTYKFIPKNEWNKVVVDRISDIHLDVKGNTDKDIGVLRVYNSDKCELISTMCRLKETELFPEKEGFSFKFEHLGVPLESSRLGNQGFYYLVLPMGYSFTELYIVDPYDTKNEEISLKKKFRYDILHDYDKNIEIVQMELCSGRGSFSFIVQGIARKISNEKTFLSSKSTNIILDKDLESPFFDEGIKKSFWKNLKESFIFEPNWNGIGIDVKKFKANKKGVSIISFK